MLSAVDAGTFLNMGPLIPVVDVRSPSEHARGHIPGSINLALFSDEERAQVGTLYKRTGRDAAVMEGLRMVGPKLADLVAEARRIAPNGRIGVHCWRGGERSTSMGWLLDKAGFAEVFVLRGGYKAFRKVVLDSFHKDRAWCVLGGRTGAGKTVVLHALHEAGQAVLDLEGFARHKGSAFGGLGRPAQPTQEQFENDLWHRLHDIGTRAPIWVEDESRMIGRRQLPDPLFAAIRDSPVFFLDVPLDQRVERLLTEYGGLPKEQLALAIRAIAKRMGPQHARTALSDLDAGDLRNVALSLLAYYDKTYAYGISARDPGTVHAIPWDGTELRALTQHLIAHAERSGPA